MPISSPRTIGTNGLAAWAGELISGAEENLLAFPGDPYRTENILIHEFAHVIQGYAMDVLDPNFNPRLKVIYQEACDNGLWEGTYAGSNVAEYWAEAVQSWFDNNRENDGIHNHVNTRAELKEYDPNLAAPLCRGVGREGLALSKARRALTQQGGLTWVITIRPRPHVFYGDMNVKLLPCHV